MTARLYAIALSLASTSLLALATPAQAFRLFSGYDANTSDPLTVLPIGQRVNSLAASQDFDQAVNNGTVTTESFESQPTSQAIDGLDLNISGVRASFSYKKPNGSSATSGSSTKVQKADSDGWTNAKTFPTDGEKGISINSSNDFSITFSQPLAAFSFWGTDLGDRDNKLAIKFSRAGNLVISQEIDYLTDKAGDSSVFFFGGLAQTAAEQFDSIQFVSTKSGDAIGLDQLTIATPEQVLGAASNATVSSAAATAVPTPALLPGLLGFALSVVRKRRKLMH